jgi:hypothetical protein
VIMIRRVQRNELSGLIVSCGYWETLGKGLEGGQRVTWGPAPSANFSCCSHLFGSHRPPHQLPIAL